MSETLHVNIPVIITDNKPPQAVITLTGYFGRRTQYKVLATCYPPASTTPRPPAQEVK